MSIVNRSRTMNLEDLEAKVEKVVQEQRAEVREIRKALNEKNKIVREHKIAARVLRQLMYG